MLRRNPTHGVQKYDVILTLRLYKTTPLDDYFEAANQFATQTVRRRINQPHGLQLAHMHHSNDRLRAPFAIPLGSLRGLWFYCTDGSDIGRLRA